MIYDLHNIIENKYKVLKSVAGPYLEDYYCLDLDTQTPVLIQALAEEWRNNESLQESFFSWAQLLMKSASHPFLLSCHQIMETDKKFKLVLSDVLIDNFYYPTNVDAFKKRASFSFEKVLALSRDLADAFSALPGFTCLGEFSLPLVQIRLNYLSQPVICPLESFWPLIAAQIDPSLYATLLNNYPAMTFPYKGSIESRSALTLIRAELMNSFLQLLYQHDNNLSPSLLQKELIDCVNEFVTGEHTNVEDFDSLQKQISRLVAQTPASKNLIWDKSIEEAIVLFILRQYELALVKLNEALSKEYENAFAHAFSGLVYERQERNSKALYHLSRAVEYAPDIIFVYGLRSWILNQLGKKELASRDLQVALAKEPNDSFLLCCHARILGANGQVKEAMGVLEPVLHLFSEEPYPFFIQGWIYNQNQLKYEGMKSFLTAIRKDANMAEAIMEVGLIYWDQNLSDADSFLTVALLYSPDWYLGYYNRGCYYEQNGYDSEAIADYEQACKYNEEDASPPFNKGNILLKQNKLDEAIVSFKEAVRRNPYHLNAQLNLGNAYEMTHKRQKAILQYKRVLELDPGHLMALYNLSLEYFKLSDYEEALHIITKAFNLYPENRDLFTFKEVLREKMNLA